MPRNDDEQKGPNHRNQGGAYKRQKTYGDGEFVLKYLRSIL
jgi:hypothetical protein